MDEDGAPLRVQNLRRRLTLVGSFRGTICTVAERDYLVRRINCEPEPLIIEALQACDAVRKSAEKLICALHEREFELLVDLILGASGWRRTSVLGESEKDFDLLIEQAATGESAFVQVKSKATSKVLDDYIKRSQSYGVSRMIFACHSPDKSLQARASAPSPGVDLWLLDHLAKKAVRCGLFDWLIKRNS